ncbi:MAG: hypothetical protein VW362_06355 [Candidatus Nanopelagicales bacterium]
MSQTMQRGPVSGTAVKKTTSRKPFLLDLYGTAVGKKYVMAITGIIGILFIIGHMVGNLKAYIGLVEHDGEMVYDLDVYAEFLRELLVPILPHGYALWGLRLGLIAALALHLHAAYSLTVINRRARPVRYQGARDYQVANFASRLALGRSHVGLVEPRLRVRGGLPEPRREPQPTSGCGAVHRRQHRARHPPVSRGVEPVPVDGMEQPPFQPLASFDRHGNRDRCRCRERLVPDHGAGRRHPTSRGLT